MVMLIVLSLICIGIFVLGYYLGNQLGRTEHVREDIRRARKENQIMRIENP